MTTPQQPPPQQPQPAGDLTADTAAALIAAGTLTEAVGILAPVYLRMKISQAALSAALGVTMAMPPGQTGFHGPAGALAARTNLARRAAFVMSAARRMQTAIEQARAQHSPGVITDALRAERRYYGQHLVAAWGREKAAAAIDSASMIHGRLLGWYTVHTPTTTPECAAADRHNFYADTPPPIGWPGMAHPGCRCYPGAPFPGAALVGAPKVQPRARAYA